MQAIRRVVPRPLRQPIRSVLAYPATLRLVSDVASFRRFRRLESFTTRWRDDEETIPIRIRELDGEALHVRPRSNDNWVLRDAFLGRHHVPPPAVDGGSLRVAWDLGAYIGATMAHLAVHHPEARIVGVEVDPANATLCRRNMEPWGERTEVVEAAVWHSDGEVAYRPADGDELSGIVAPAGEPGVTAPAISLNTLLERSGGAIDYVKMDIEGAEREVLRRNTEWAEHVRSIKVEVHPPYEVDECLADLGALGFRTSVDLIPPWPAHPQVAGVR